MPLLGDPGGEREELPFKTDGAGSQMINDMNTKSCPATKYVVWAKQGNYRSKMSVGREINEISAATGDDVQRVRGARETNDQVPDDLEESEDNHIKKWRHTRSCPATKYVVWADSGRYRSLSLSGLDVNQCGAAMEEDRRDRGELDLDLSNHGEETVESHIKKLTHTRSCPATKYRVWADSGRYRSLSEGDMEPNRECARDVSGGGDRGRSVWKLQLGVSVETEDPKERQEPGPHIKKLPFTWSCPATKQVVRTDSGTERSIDEEEIMPNKLTCSVRLEWRDSTDSGVENSEDEEEDDIDSTSKLVPVNPVHVKACPGVKSRHYHKRRRHKNKLCISPHTISEYDLNHMQCKAAKIRTRYVRRKKKSILNVNIEKKEVKENMNSLNLNSKKLDLISERMASAENQIEVVADIHQENTEEEVLTQDTFTQEDAASQEKEVPAGTVGASEGEKKKKPRMFTCKEDKENCKFKTEKRSEFNSHLKQVHGKKIGKDKVEKTPELTDIASAGSTPGASPNLPTVGGGVKRKADNDADEPEGQRKLRAKLDLLKAVAQEDAAADDEPVKIGEDGKIDSQATLAYERHRDGRIQQLQKQVGNLSQENEEVKAKLTAMQVKEDVLRKQLKEWKEIGEELGELVDKNVGVARQKDVPARIEAEKKVVTLEKKLKEKEKEMAQWISMSQQQHAMLEKNEKYIKEIQQKIAYLEKKETCKDFLAGKCIRGSACRYSHDVTNKEVPREVMAQILYGEGDVRKAEQQQQGSQSMTISFDQDDCFHWMRGSCRYGQNCKKTHNMEKYGVMLSNNGEKPGARKRSSSHGTIQSFQRGSGQKGGNLDPINESPKNFTQMKKQLDKQRMELGLMEIPQSSFSAGAKDVEIQRLHEASGKLDFQAQMALARLESIKETSRMTGDRVQQLRIQESVYQKNAN